jgi:serine/threonine protein kinase
MTRSSPKPGVPGSLIEYRGRPFLRATVPAGDNRGQLYIVARQIADRYEVQGFFASGGCGLLLAGRDVRTETEVLIKTTLRYEVAHEAMGRDRDGFTRQLKGPRKQLQTERRIMVLLRNLGCDGIATPNDYVYDWNPALEGPYRTHGADEWKYDEESMLSSEPYLIMERVAGQSAEQALDELPDGMPEKRALGILFQVSDVLRLLHRPITLASGATWQLIYQDLKPANILLGSRDRATLLDMGGCFLRVNGVPGMRGACTPGYCPPEAVKDAGGCQWTPAFDSYLVGSTLFHMITGKPPSDFLVGRLSAIGPSAVAFDAWDWPLLEGRCTVAACDFIKACLAPKPEDRPRDGEALYQALAKLARRL